MDLIKRLNGVVHKSGPAKGRIVDVSKFGDFANTLGQILAVRGLAAAGSGKAGSVRQFLLQQQCRAGFFRLNFAKLKSDNQGCRKSSPADPDATSYAVVELWKTSKGHPAFRKSLEACRLVAAGPAAQERRVHRRHQHGDAQHQQHRPRGMGARHDGSLRRRQEGRVVGHRAPGRPPVRRLDARG